MEAKRTLGTDWPATHTSMGESETTTDYDKIMMAITYIETKKDIDKLDCLTFFFLF